MPKEEPIEPKEEPIDTTEMISPDNQSANLDYVGEQMDCMEGMPNDDVNNRMEDIADEDINNSLNEEPANNDSVEDSIRTIQVSGISDNVVDNYGDKDE
ncbi:hypothetical protein PENTCL1PPCAC_19139 [Pristionchus entomophagus]|uniref:Uncharacterized protein n=1 Tax=Pristionchus entomophagus TaxID=358040 RepID=A0AAV5TRX1_9BILA|nr:hypothetical protein PENTCL1PPCAC_19139 [Pristionchus entomophagus]